MLCPYTNQPVRTNPACEKVREQRLYFFFSHDTATEVKGHNVTSVVGGQLALPQNSSRALCTRMSSFSQSYDHKSYVTHHHHPPLSKNLRLSVVSWAISLRCAQSEVSLHQHCWTVLASFNFGMFCPTSVAFLRRDASMLHTCTNTLLVPLCFELTPNKFTYVIFCFC